MTDLASQCRFQCAGFAQRGMDGASDYRSPEVAAGD